MRPNQLFLFVLIGALAVILIAATGAQNWLEQYQTLVAGILALVGALITCWVINRQINAHLETTQDAFQRQEKERARQLRAATQLVKAELGILKAELEMGRIKFEDISQQSGGGASTRRRLLSCKPTTAAIFRFSSWQSAFADSPEALQLLAAVNGAIEELSDALGWASDEVATTASPATDEELEIIRDYVAGVFKQCQQAVELLQGTLAPDHQISPNGTLRMS